MKKIYTLLIINILLVGNIFAADIYVSSGGDDTTGDGTSGNPYATISQAISVANDNDVIKIVGTISSTSSASISSLVDKSITIEGTDETATITGFSGGARVLNINTAYTGTVTLRNLIFLNNTTTNNFGGSVLLNNQTGATVIIENCTFTGNSATTDVSSNGGGAIAMLNGTLTITNSNFSANTTLGQSGGGAIYFSGSTNSTITGTTFYNNTTTNTTANQGRGGAINFNNSSGTNNITNCTFFENKNAQTGNFHGAAIRVNSTSATTSVSVSNSLFFNNLSDNGAGSTSDFNGPGQPTMSFTNSLGQYGNNIDNTTGSIINNGGAVGMNTGANISSSNLTWNATENRVEFTAPTSISNNTPIDFGNDNNDVGSWDSQINLFKGTTDSDWATGANWSSTAIPTSSENVTLLSDSPAVVIGSTTGAVCNDLSVDGSSSLSITQGGSLIVSGTSTGNITYNVAVTDDNWHLLGAPFTGQAFDNTWANSNGIATSTNNTALRGISTYQNGPLDGSTGPWLYLQTDNTNAGTFGSGTGYSIKNASVSGGVYPITGTYTTAPASANITIGSSSAWNLVSNPFSSYIDVAAFLTENTTPLADAFISIYVWNASTSSYASLTNGYIQPGQGFFVNSESASTSVNFTSAMISHQTGVTFYKTANDIAVNLSINDGAATRTTYLNYESGKTKGLDPRFDLGLFDGVSSDLRIFTHLVENSQGINFHKQSLPNSDFENMVVPVGIKAAAGKELTFTSEAINLPEGLKVFLEDRENNTFTELTTTSNYKVTLNAAVDGSGRFFLHTKSAALSTDDVSLTGIGIYNINKNTLRISGVNTTDASVKLYNILGRKVVDQSFSSKGVYDVSLPNLNTGVYIVQLSTEKGKISKKIILE